ncbi:hypothetical protein CLOM_g22539 [Closterium sp. NIES-68]|nr:hypothetical protein CLOM_g22539 [Closterium sp. NIES-68]
MVQTPSLSPMIPAEEAEQLAAAAAAPAGGTLPRGRASGVGLASHGHMVSERKTAAEEAEQLSAAAADSSSSSRSSSGGWVVSGQARARSERGMVPGKVPGMVISPPCFVPTACESGALEQGQDYGWSPPPLSLPLLPLSPSPSSITP